MDQPPGLGDFTRGCIALHQLAQKLGFNLCVDFSCHPLGQFLENPGFDYSQLHSPVEVLEFFNSERDSVEPYICQWLKEEPLRQPLFLISHKFPSEPLLEETKTFMRGVFAASQQTRAAIAELKRSLDLPAGYCALHLRTGDDNNNIPSINRRVIDWLEREIAPKWGKNVLVVSDNHQLKAQLSQAYGLKCTGFAPVHLGSTASFFPQPGGAPSVFGTLLEFLLLAQSQAIHAYTNYPWKSGFSYACSNIYDIPFFEI